MGLFERLKSNRFKHAEGESGEAFLARLARESWPPVPYADSLRWPVMELCRQVTELHEQVSQLRTEVAELRG